MSSPLLCPICNSPNNPTSKCTHNFSGVAEKKIQFNASKETKHSFSRGYTMNIISPSSTSTLRCSPEKKALLVCACITTIATIIFVSLTTKR